MTSTVAELKPLLFQSGIEYREEDGSVFIELPNEFGELQVLDLEENEDLVGLVGSDWHTHSNCLGDQDTPKAEKVKRFVADILEGAYLLIEEKEPGKEPRKTIQDNFEAYLKYLPKRAKYHVYYGT